MSGVESMPLELRERPQWVLWREEQRDGKLTKVPYRPADPSKRASATDPGTWAPFEEARSALRLDDGLGYVFATNDPYCGVDIDGCRDPETGLLDPEAGAVVQGLNSYTEASVSGTGVHAIVQAELPGTRRRTGKYEMYSDGRYFAMTGEHLAGTPTTIEERQVELETLYFTLFPPSENGDKPTLLASPAALDNVELIEKAMAAKDGEKFRRLWSGDWSGYDSQSEADLALCSLLAFWTGTDPSRMDSMFRSSELMREKWVERHGEMTYGVHTIAKAIEGKTETYSPTRLPVPSPETAPSSPERHRGEEPPNETDKVPDAAPNESVVEGGAGRNAYTDLGNAELFARRNVEALRYVKERRQWLLWSGGRWKRLRSPL